MQQRIKAMKGTSRNIEGQEGFVRNSDVWEATGSTPYLEYRKSYEVMGEAPVVYVRVKGSTKEYRVTLDMARSFKSVCEDEVSVFIEIMQSQYGCIVSDIEKWKQSHPALGL